MQILDLFLDVPPNVLHLIKEISDVAGTDIVKKGISVGSLEGEETAGLDYRVTTGRSIRPHRAVWNYITKDLMAIISRCLALELELDNNPNSCVTINHLFPGKRYELHVDTNPLTALLFVNTLPPQAYGQFEAVYKDEHIFFRSIAGRCLVFDGREIPHRVTTVAEGFERISMPISLHQMGTPYARDESLDGDLFGV